MKESLIPKQEVETREYEYSRYLGYLFEDLDNGNVDRPTPTVATILKNVIELRCELEREKSQSVREYHWREVLRNPNQLESKPDVTLEDFERALDYLDGKPRDSKWLVKVVGCLEGERTRDVELDTLIKIEGLPDRRGCLRAVLGSVFLGVLHVPDENIVRRIKKDRDMRISYIKGLSETITQNPARYITS